MPQKFRQSYHADGLMTTHRSCCSSQPLNAVLSCKAWFAGSKEREIALASPPSHIWPEPDCPPSATWARKILIVSALHVTLLSLFQTSISMWQCTTLLCNSCICSLTLWFLLTTIKSTCGLTKQVEIQVCCICICDNPTQALWTMLTLKASYRVQFAVLPISVCVFSICDKQ